MNALLRGEPLHRPMTLRDLDVVVAAERAAYACPWNHANFADSLSAGYRAELRLAASGELVGYSVAMTALDEIHLLNLTVRLELQGRGHGRAMLERLVGLGADAGLRSLWLEVRPSNARALTLYLRRGFQETGRRVGYYPAGDQGREDAIVMRLTLPPAPAESADALD